MKHNKFCGEGMETVPGSYVYKGRFAGSLKNGHGVVLKPEGSNFEGTFRNNKFEGYGKYTWRDGKKYGKIIGLKGKGCLSGLIKGTMLESMRMM